MLDGEGERFLAELHADQGVYLADPSRETGDKTPRTVTAWAEIQPAKAWRRMKLRDGEKGELVAEFLTTRVFVWDRQAPAARCWRLLVRREIGGTKLKFCPSNAKAGASLRQLIAMQASRHFVERAFEDAKGACGMADYQVRGWDGWYHHMALVMVALMFLAKERLAGSDTHRLLPCLDIVDIVRHKLPSKIQSDEDLVNAITNRHERRRKPAEPHCEKQGITLPASFGWVI